MSSTKAEKLIYRLDEVCRLANMDAQTVEAWETELDLIQPGQTAAGIKIFRKKDVDIIKRLKELLDDQGYTLAGAKRRIEEEFGIKKNSQINQDNLKKTLFRIRENLKEIKEKLQE